MSSPTEDDPFADLFDAEPRRRRRQRPTPDEARARLEQSRITASAAAVGRSFDDIGGMAALKRPVTKGTLAFIFDMDKQTVQKRLATCPSHGHGNRQLYDFKTAVSYLIKPQMTPEQFIKTLNTADLPPAISLHFWESQRRRIKFKIEAQEAWETADVLEVFGETFKVLKDSLQMAVEEVRERARLTDEQAVLFEQFIDELRENLRERLLELPKQRQTPSLLDQPLFGTGAKLDPAVDPFADDDDDEDYGE